MAKYFLRIKTLSRGKGARATRAAAYRAGEAIRDERTGQVYNFSNRQDVVYKEIVLPSEFADSADVNWARERSALWNAAEHAGRQRNSRVAREVLVILPPELTASQRRDLVRSFSRELADKYRNAVDVAIHPPRPGGDERHNHAHLLMTTREVTAEGLGRRTTIELGGEDRKARGLGPGREEYFWVRARWAQCTNEALREAGVAARVDHRSFKDQGIDREPTPTMPQKVYYKERKSGMTTQAGDEIRARHRERVEARLKGGDELARVLRRQKEEDRRRAINSSNEKEGISRKIPHGALTREELNQLRMEWHHAHREAVNKRRRELYKENAEVRRDQERARRRANAQQINERRRQWRKENAERVNQQARERWAKAREQRLAAANAAQQSTFAEGKTRALGRNSPPAAAEECTRKRVEMLERSQPRSPTAEESVRKWLEMRDRNSSRGPTAEESARKWLEMRDRNSSRGSTAEESARKWLEMREGNSTRAPSAEESAAKWLEIREGHGEKGASPTASEGPSDGRGFDADVPDDDEYEHNRKHERGRGQDYDDDYGL